MWWHFDDHLTDSFHIWSMRSSSIYSICSSRIMETQWWTLVFIILVLIHSVIELNDLEYFGILQCMDNSSSLNLAMSIKFVPHKNGFKYCTYSDPYKCVIVSSLALIGLILCTTIRLSSGCIAAGGSRKRKEEASGKVTVSNVGISQCITQACQNHWALLKRDLKQRVIYHLCLFFTITMFKMQSVGKNKCGWCCCLNKWSKINIPFFRW